MDETKVSSAGKADDESELKAVATPVAVLTDESACVEETPSVLERVPPHWTCPLDASRQFSRLLTKG